MLWLLFIFVFSLLGMEMFAYTVFVDADGKFYLTQETIQEAYASGVPLYAPRENFNNIFFAMVTIFVMCTGENWPGIASIYLRAAREKSKVFNLLAQIYFLVVTVLGFILLLSLFTALLLQNFDHN